MEFHDAGKSNDDKYLHYLTDELKSLNDDIRTNNETDLRIGLLMMGRPAPGSNNIVDGMLRFAKKRGNVHLIGFSNGLKGVFDEHFFEVTEESFANFRNLGGCDYLGRSLDQLSTIEERKTTMETCQKLKLNGLVMIGATHTLTDSLHLNEYFLAHECNTRVIAVPATVEGNIQHGYIGTSLGFDTASKVYSQHVGNMLTDSASAIKYWYFIRLAGKDPSHVVLECAHNTHPNMTIISEECSHRNETLQDIVNRIVNLVVQRW